jgi:acyl-CoA reductase-like NAD-dependent aldehyde dehydrogenase
MPTVALDSLSEAARRFVEQAPHGLLIGGEFSPAADGRTFETIDPATGEVICEVAFAGPDDVDRAVKAAGAAMEGEWSSAPAAQREALMNRLADLIDEHGQELAELPLSSPESPFGGYKASGLGREMGHANLDAYLEIKTVWTNLR